MMKLNVSMNKMSTMALALLAAYAVMLLPMDAAAQIATPTGLSSVLCSVVAWMTGGLGAAIATLAIIVIGVGALMGKVSWGMAIIVGIGIGVVFGAPSIVAAFTSATC
jgi:type IV secretion system protein VirB2